MRAGTTVKVMAVLMCIVFVHSAFGLPTVCWYPTGTTIYKPDKCWSGYTLIPHDQGPIKLIDMNGNVVKKWDFDSIERARLLPNGHLLLLTAIHRPGEKDRREGGKFIYEYEYIGVLENTLAEYDWEGNLVWEYKAPGIIHHDFQRLPNGNTIFLYKVEVPKEYMKSVKDLERKFLKLGGDCVCEINPKGEVVWEWYQHEYLDLNKYSPTDNLRDWTHTNTVQVLPENHWYDEGHKEFKPGNVLINPRNLDLCLIIDRQTKKIVWEYSGDYKGGIAHPHETVMIEPGMPGAGNILIFDNGMGPRAQRSGQSFILEINPVTKEVVWSYDKPRGFYSPYRAAQQRLPNGNTLIDEAVGKRVFEVTSEGKTVWEYVTSAAPRMEGQPLRAKRYAYDYCPQLKALGKPKELTVTPPEMKPWQLVPDALR